MSRITKASDTGIWLFHLGKEYFLSYEEFPWFRRAAVESVFNVVAESDEHLSWPDLDVDLSLESIRDPGLAPLVYEPEEPNGQAKD